jgi:hypothetical protein
MGKAYTKARFGRSVLCNPARWQASAEKRDAGWEGVTETGKAATERAAPASSCRDTPGMRAGRPRLIVGGKAGPRWRPQRRALGGFEAGAQAAVPAFERGLETTPAWRLFRGLVDTLKQWASDRGADRIVWETRRGRPRAWARIGGTPISTVYELLPRDGRNDQSVDSTALTTE